MTEWQAGETAPKDGMPFLSDICGPYPCVTWYDAADEYPWKFFWHLGPDHLSGEDEPHIDGFFDDHGPKRWMPLPASPPRWRDA